MKLHHTRTLQSVFLLLLAISSAQVAWWVFENAHYSRATADRLEALHVASAEALSAALSGADVEQIDGILKSITISEDTRRASVLPSRLGEIKSEAARRMNRYYWEGGFFLIVLVVAMAGLAATIRRDRELARRQQNFLASVSHEFKSPLASIQLAAESLNRRAQDEETKRWGSRILVDCERLLRTVDNLLNTNRLDEGIHNPIPETIELSKIIRSIADEFAERLRHNDIAMSVECDESITLHSDVISLETILRNVVDNALKACVAGRGGSAITIRASRDPRNVTVHIIDDGIGFEPAESELLFDKFFRVGDEQRRTTPGTGLGLYIVARLAVLSKATISAHSAGPNQGATITVRWDIR
jgi:signal transduction histidine kinase